MQHDPRYHRIGEGEMNQSPIFHIPKYGMSGQGQVGSELMRAARLGSQIHQSDKVAVGLEDLTGRHSRPGPKGIV